MPTLPIHQAAELFPLMPEADLQALADDIRANGQREPITTYQGHVLDGRNRQRACDLAGVPPRYEEWDGKGTPLAFVLSKNLHRRHLTTEQRKELAKALLKENPALSARGVAEQVKLSDKTVGGVRRELEATAEIPRLATRTGKDGKERLVPPPAAKPAEPKSHREKLALLDLEPADAEQARRIMDALPAADKVGRLLDRQATEAFLALDLFDELDGVLKRAESLINDLARMPGGEEYRRRLKLTMKGDVSHWHSADVRNARAELQFARPFARVCPYCHHAGRPNSTDCKACHGLPYVIENTWDHAPEDYRDAITGAAERAAA